MKLQLVLLLLSMVLASAQMIGPGAVTRGASGIVLKPTLETVAGGGGGSPTPVYFTHTNQVDTTTRFMTNTVDLSGLPNPIIINVWHQWNDPAYQTNLANGISMTFLVVTNGYAGNPFTFGISYIIPPSNGLYKVAINTADTSPAEKTVETLIYTNVHQTVPFGTVVIDYSAASRPGVTNTITSAENDLIFDAIGWNVDAVGSVGSGQTQRGLADPAPNDSAIATSEKLSEGTSSIMRWSGFSSGVQVWAGAAMKAP